MNSNTHNQPHGRPERGGRSGFLSRFNIPVSEELLTLALTHRSYAFEQGLTEHNERLEFLGDAILGQAVTLKLFHDFPDLPEGELAKRRASLVSSAALAEVARSLHLGDALLLGKGEQQTGGRDKGSILADTLEAVIGAVYLDRGPAEATQFIHSLMASLLEDPTRFTTALDPKTSLQEIAAALGEPPPSYTVSGEGPDHDRVFTATVAVNSFVGSGTGTSKKAAEIAAARDAFEQYINRVSDK